MWKVILLVLLTIPVLAQEKKEQEKPKAPPKIVSAKPVPTQLEQLTIENLQKDARLIQLEIQMKEAQAGIPQLNERFKRAINRINAEVDKIKQAHKWGDDVEFVLETAKFRKKPKKDE